MRSGQPWAPEQVKPYVTAGATAGPCEPGRAPFFPPALQMRLCAPCGWVPGSFKTDLLLQLISMGLVVTKATALTPISAHFPANGAEPTQVSSSSHPLLGALCPEPHPSCCLGIGPPKLSHQWQCVDRKPCQAGGGGLGRGFWEGVGGCSRGWVLHDHRLVPGSD